MRIALWQFISTSKNEILISDFIRPICLPSTDYTVNPPSKFALTVAGWGRYLQFDNGTVRSSKIKLHVTLPFVQRDVSNIKSKIRQIHFTINNCVVFCSIPFKINYVRLLY